MIEHPLSEEMSGGLSSEVLIDGKWIEYHQCDDSRKPRTLIPDAVYLGKSKEVRHNGVVQEPWEKAYYFWRKQES
ncbi:MAG: hypothetical protein ISR95_01110 [Candidatus Marinimicrobia bacterium]|nr:hypothetical protein [Candidatus Neomarinimicrobiota bacterium]